MFCFLSGRQALNSNWTYLLCFYYYVLIIDFDKSRPEMIMSQNIVLFSFLLFKATFKLLGVKKD